MSGDMDSEDVWADVDVLPGPGMVYDKQSGMFKGRMRADEVPEEALPRPKADVALAREKLRKLANETRKGVLKK